MYKADLAQIAYTQIGTWCYVWGGNGEDMSAMTDTERESWIKSREKDGANRNKVKNLYNKLASEGVNPIRGGDCSGFVSWLMKQLGLWKTDKKANTMYCECDATASPEAGDLAFRIDAGTGKATHVGICVGDGYFIHCKGRDVGVVKEKCSAKYWQAYGIIKDFTPAPVPPPVPPEPTTEMVKFLGSVNLREQPMLQGKVKAIAHKGDKLPLLSRGYTDSRGVEWYAVDYKGTTLYSSAYTGEKKKYTEIVNE